MIKQRGEFRGRVLVMMAKEWCGRVMDVNGTRQRAPAHPRPAPRRRLLFGEGRGAGERHSAPACATHPASVGRGHLALGARLPRHPPRGWRWPPPSFLRIVATGEAADDDRADNSDAH